MAASFRRFSRQSSLLGRRLVHQNSPDRATLSRDFSSAACMMRVMPLFSVGWTSSLLKATRVGAAAASAATWVVVVYKLAADVDESTPLRISKEHGESNALGSTHCFEPGTIEEMQLAVADCFGSSCHFASKQDRLFVAMSDGESSIDDKDIQENRGVNTDFPSLSITHLNDNCGGTEFELNSQTPIPIENDFFSGSILVTVQPQSTEDDSCLKKDYFQDRDRFEIQIQGRFKRIPEGTLYCGAELADKDFQFNTFMRGLSNVLLKLMRRYIGPNVLYSYGEKDASGRKQLPHISFPLKTAMYNVIVTPPVAMAPSMGEAFEETEESRASRKTSTDINDWNMEDTYSMSFSGSCIDLPNWRVVDPYNVSLERFWGKSPLRLVIYEKREDREGSTHDTVQDANNYLFALQIQFLGEQSVVCQNVVDQQHDQVDRRLVGIAAYV